MRRLLIGATLAAVGLITLAASTPARALIALPATSPWQNVQEADTIIIGNVVQILDQDIKATVEPKSKQEVDYRIAVLMVRDTIRGDVKGNVVRVGFIVPQQNQPFPGGIRPQPVPLPAPAVPPVQGQRLPAQAPAQIQPAQIQIQPAPQPGFVGRVPYFGMQLAQGMDGMFFLKKHHTGKFYTVASMNGYVSSENKQAFDATVAMTKKAPNVLKNPQKALKSNDAEERLMAASMLLSTYRSNHSPKTEPIDAEESKAILKALHDADWDFRKYSYNYQMNPQNLFQQLAIGPKEGFQRPRPLPNQNYQEVFTQAAKDWLKKNMNSYRIQRFVPQPGQPGQPGSRPGVRPVPGGPIQIQPLPVDRPQILPVQPVPGGQGRAEPARPIEVDEVQPLPEPAPQPRR